MESNVPNEGAARDDIAHGNVAAQEEPSGIPINQSMTEDIESSTVNDGNNFLTSWPGETYDQFMERVLARFPPQPGRKLLITAHHFVSNTQASTVPQSIGRSYCEGERICAQAPPRPRCRSRRARTQQADGASAPEYATNQETPHKVA